MLKHNYHTHTKFCKHAENDAETIIKHAINLKFETLGFSEHMQISKNLGMSRIADDQEEKIFINQINNLKEKYRQKITIFCGFEADIVDPNTGKEIIDYAISKKNLPGVDYLIIGHHWYTSKNHTYISKPTMQEAKQWMETLIKAWNTGKFAYIAHPDGFANAYDNQWDEVAFFLAEQITKYAAANNMPLGFNINGLYEQKGYPSEKFWKIAKQNGASAIMELDAHNLEVFDHKYSQQGYQILKKIGVKIVNKLTL